MATATNASAVTFPAATGGSNTATHFGVGTDSSGAGTLLFSSALDSSLAISSGITPQFAQDQLTISTSGADWENTFEVDLLELILENTTLANVGDATGLVGSSGAGSLYVSLHTADPVGGNQTTSECDYTSYARVAVSRAGASWTIS